MSPEEQAKREEYRRRLAEYLKDPAFRAIEGFPIGTDEDILALSDPPYYTACPNPFIPEIIAEWQEEREGIRKELGLKEESYQREPFAADVSEGKNHPIYNAHSYHTKVPHKAIMRYILHYTDPGDIVFDGFCGTGMTGIAAQLCGDKKAVESLGYRVDEKGVIWEDKKAISRLGARKAVLNDLSPAATFIAYNYNTPVDAASFECETKQVLKEVEQECGWMYETWHPHCDDLNRVKGRINYTVWSDVFVCPQCNTEMAFWDVAVDTVKGVVRPDWECPDCSVKLAKTPSKNSQALRVGHAWEIVFDTAQKKTINRIKQKIIFINYLIGKRSFDKRPDEKDFALVEKIKNISLNYSVPLDRMIPGGESRRNDDIGLTNIHHFYTRRNLIILSALWEKSQSPEIKWLITAIMQRANKQHQIAISRISKEHKQEGGKTAGHRRGTWYVPSNQVEFSPFELLKGRFKIGVKAKSQSLFSKLNFLILTNSSTEVGAKNESLDYIFIDPPFGTNIWYSELNFLWEAWLNVFTNNKKEVIIGKPQKKGLFEYYQLMTQCFKEFYRILKPGRWITIEFHNTENRVWNSIQEALQFAGFVVADVRVLDKQKKTHTQVTSKGSVDKDLVISAYKPNGNLENNFRLIAGTEKGVWEFIRYHLNKLPILNHQKDGFIVNVERQEFLLFDRMVAFHIRRGVMVPISAQEFYAGLEHRFIPRDGMYFLPAQVAEYDRAVLDNGKPTQLSLFVNDEKTAITWLRQQLDPASGGEPKTQGDLTNDFNRVMNRAKHEQPLELIELLKQNFLQDEDGKWYVPDHNKATDLEKVRQRSLLKEFKEYTESTGRLRVFRSEAVRAGFADCYKRQEYNTLVKVAERLPENVLREDPDLLMYYDSALLRKR
ncbi:MAG: hypothetical protein BGO78_06030 [Chloroflexi bacterium 44-23]|nr:MAG: hypothetical protein BGO78_06030 [Chloroflexi bacterium 44-23]